MSTQGDFGVKLRPNCFRLATVKSVSYDPGEESSIWKETIKLETTDGDTFLWCIGTYSSMLCMKDFLEARKNILSDLIIPGTEITLKCTSDKIVAFAL